MVSAFTLSGGNPELQWLGWGIACFSCSIWIYMGYKDKDIPKSIDGTNVFAFGSAWNMELDTMVKLDKWSEDLNLLEGTDRLVYLVDLAKKATSLPAELRTDDRLIGGCISQIWVDVGVVEGNVKVYYDSDAMITKGITSIVADCFSDIPVAEAKQITFEDFEKLNIPQLFTS